MDSLHLQVCISAASEATVNWVTHGQVFVDNLSCARVQCEMWEFFPDEVSLTCQGIKTCSCVSGFNHLTSEFEKYVLPTFQTEKYK